MLCSYIYTITRNLNNESCEIQIEWSNMISPSPKLLSRMLGQIGLLLTNSRMMLLFRKIIKSIQHLILVELRLRKSQHGHIFQLVDV